MWQRWCGRPLLNIDKYSDHGWSEDGEAIWSKDYISGEIKDILYDEAVNNDKDENDELLDEEDNNGDDEEDEDDDVELFNYN